MKTNTTTHSYTRILTLVSAEYSSASVSVLNSTLMEYDYVNIFNLNIEIQEKDIVLKVRHFCHHFTELEKLKIRDDQLTDI